MTLTFFVATAYLLGSISFAVLMSKLFGLADPRTYGSGNPGATNVLRSGKKIVAALTLLGDAAKGGIAVFLAIQLAPRDENWALLVALVALAVFIGHLFPVFHKFQGGKGVATALGVLFALDVWVCLGAVATWLGVALVTRLSSLAALIAAIATPIYAMLAHLPVEWVVESVLMSLLLFWRHKRNIANLLAGKESKIGSRKKKNQSS